MELMTSTPCGYVSKKHITMSRKSGINMKLSIT